MDARLQVLESLYRFDLDESTHIRLIQETASHYWEKRGPVTLVTGHLTRAGGFDLSPLNVTRDERGDYARAILDVFPNIPAKELRMCLAAPPTYGGAIEAGNQGKLSSQMISLLTHCMGVGDMLGFYSGTQEGGLISLTTFTTSRSPVSRRESDHWQPLADHLAAAWRLRQRLDTGAAVEDLTDAVFRPDGRMSESRMPMSGSVRERLRELVLRREIERSGRTATCGLWSELIAGRWTLVDHFESSGRRVVVVLRNTPTGDNLGRLTEREIEVLEQARAGASNKEIGLSMNLSKSSVTRLLQSAAQKLNASLADVLQFSSMDVIRVRDLLLGESNLLVISKDTVDAWRDVLSDAERGVVTGVLRGQSNREIATMRGRSVRTVVNQLSSAFEKLGVRSRRELLNQVSGLAPVDVAEEHDGSSLER